MKRKKVLPLPASYTDEEHVDSESTNNHLVPSFHSSSPPSTEAPVPELLVPEAKPKVKTRLDDDNPSEFDVIDKDFIDLSGERVKLDVMPEVAQLPAACTEPEVVINDAVPSAIEVDASVTEDIFLVPCIPPEVKEESSSTTAAPATAAPSAPATAIAITSPPPPAEELRSPLPSPISLQNVVDPPPSDKNELPITKTAEAEEHEQEEDEEVEEEEAAAEELELEDEEEEEEEEELKAQTEGQTKVQPSSIETVSVDVNPPVKFNCVMKEEPINHFISGSHHFKSLNFLKYDVKYVNNVSIRSTSSSYGSIQFQELGARPVQTIQFQEFWIESTRLVQFQEPRSKSIEMAPIPGIQRGSESSRNHYEFWNA